MWGSFSQDIQEMHKAVQRLLSFPGRFLRVCSTLRQFVQALIVLAIATVAHLTLLKSQSACPLMTALLVSQKVSKVAHASHRASYCLPHLSTAGNQGRHSAHFTPRSRFDKTPESPGGKIWYGRMAQGRRAAFCKLQSRITDQVQIGQAFGSCCAANAVMMGCEAHSRCQRSNHALVIV